MNNQNFNPFAPNNQKGLHNIYKKRVDPSEKYSFSKIKNPAKTRLKDLTDTSYLNSVLFCLSNIRNIVSYFLNPENFVNIDKNISSKPLSFVFERLMYHLYEKDSENENCYSPESFWKVLSKLNVVYNTLLRRNPNDLINYILNVLHIELNNNANKGKKIDIANIEDKRLVIKNGVNNFRANENSIISNNLNWFEIKENYCNF